MATFPLVGDWNGGGHNKVGVFCSSDGTFYLDYNGNGVWDGCGTDRCLQIGMLNDVPLVGDWNGSGTSQGRRVSADRWHLYPTTTAAGSGTGAERTAVCRLV